MLKWLQSTAVHLWLLGSQTLKYEWWSDLWGVIKPVHSLEVHTPGSTIASRLWSVLTNNVSHTHCLVKRQPVFGHLVYCVRHKCI